MSFDILFSKKFTPSSMAEQIQVDVHALQMEYAQQLTNEDFGEPRGARQMEDAQLLRDVEMGDPGNTHDVNWARHNRAICRPIGGLRVADVQPRQPVHPGEYGRGRMDALAYGARNSRTLRDVLRTQHGAQKVGLY